MINHARLDMNWFAFVAKALHSQSDPQNIDFLEAAYEGADQRPSLRPGRDQEASVQSSIADSVFDYEERKLVSGPARSMFVRHMDFVAGERSVFLTPKGLALLRAPEWRQLVFFLVPRLKHAAGGIYGKVKGPIAVGSTLAGICKIVIGWSDVKLIAAAIAGLVLAAVLENT